MRLIQKYFASLLLRFVTCGSSLLLNKLRHTSAARALEQEIVTGVCNELRVLPTLPLLLDGDLGNEHLWVGILVLLRGVRLFKHLLHRRVGTSLHVIRVYLLVQLRA